MALILCAYVFSFAPTVFSQSEYEEPPKFPRLQINPSDYEDEAWSVPSDQVVVEVEGDESNKKPMIDDSRLFFDANITEMTKDGSKQTFRGDVVVVTGGVVLTADKIEVDATKGVLTADGHVVILTKEQVFVGDRINYYVDTKNFLFVNSSMILSDKKESEEISKRLLGFTAEEVAFEKIRKSRLEAIDDRKKMLRSDAKNQALTTAQLDDLVDKYALVLEQEELIKNQENIHLSRMSRDRRNRFKMRRQYWERAFNSKENVAKGSTKYTSFFRVSGDKLERVGENQYKVDGAFWTPCNCGEDEVPPWGFSSTSMDARVEGYVDLYNSVLRIKGVPILYFPYIKVPIKSKRQSGFLLPVFANTDFSGLIYSQPVYFDLGDDLDATFTTEIHEKRGTKLAFETRYQYRRYSGFTLKLEGIKDRSWTAARRVRENLLDYWTKDDNYTTLSPTQFVDELTQEEQLTNLRSRLGTGNNSWRGSVDWSALHMFSPRLSLTANGTWYSDHRYMEDLQVTDDFAFAFDSTFGMPFLTSDKFKLNWDERNYYVGVGSSFGDAVLTNEQFAGYQIPLYLTAQSRLFSLDGGKLIFPIYGYLQGDLYALNARREDTLRYRDTVANVLGDGKWSRMKFSILSPVITQGIMKTEYFADGEIRYINNPSLTGTKDDDSYINSWRTGLTLRLPLDGEWQLPDFLQRDVETQGYRSLEHWMEWLITFSIRPDVVRKGDYGSIVDGKELVYFTSDKQNYIADGNEIEQDDTMSNHRKVTFRTIQNWYLIDRDWSLIPGTNKSNETVSSSDRNYHKIARYELLNSLDRSVSDADEMYDETLQEWYINRYKLVDGERSRKVYLDANISYDFLLAEQRKEMIAEKDDAGVTYAEADLAQPWSLARMSLGIDVLKSSVRSYLEYNVYLKDFVREYIRVEFPSLYQTNFFASYDVGRAADYNEEVQNLIWSRTRTVSFGINSKILPGVELFASYARRSRGTTGLEVDSAQLQPSEYETKYGFNYVSDSDCWGISFLRSKIFEDGEDQAEYLLRFTAMFMEQNRELPLNFMDYVSI